MLHCCHAPVAATPPENTPAQLQRLQQQTQHCCRQRQLLLLLLLRLLLQPTRRGLQVEG
jgi:hypothetical protein